MSLTINTNTETCDSYIMDSNIQIKSMRKGGRLNQSIILTYTDDSEWVFLNNKGQERFCGFLYLKNALIEMRLNNIKAADNKIAIHDRKIIYLSQYCGEKKPEVIEHLNELSSLEKDIGFTDMAAGANLRKMNEAIYVFDTEKCSFNSNVHQKIDSFVHLHNSIRLSLEKKIY